MSVTQEAGSPDSPGAEYQQIEDSEEELIADAAEDVQQQQLQQQGSVGKPLSFSPKDV